MTQLSKSVLRQKVHSSPVRERMAGKALAREIFNHRKQELHQLKQLSESDWKVLERSSDRTMAAAYKELKRLVKNA